MLPKYNKLLQAVPSVYSPLPFFKDVYNVRTKPFLTVVKDSNQSPLVPPCHPDVYIIMVGNSFDDLP